MAQNKLNLVRLMTLVVCLVVASCGSSDEPPESAVTTSSVSSATTEGAVTTTAVAPETTETTTTTEPPPTEADDSQAVAGGEDAAAAIADFDAAGAGFASANIVDGTMGSCDAVDLDALGVAFGLDVDSEYIPRNVAGASTRSCTFYEAGTSSALAYVQVSTLPVDIESDFLNWGKTDKPPQSLDLADGAQWYDPDPDPDSFLPLNFSSLVVSEGAVQYMINGRLPDSEDFVQMPIDSLINGLAVVTEGLGETQEGIGSDRFSTCEDLPIESFDAEPIGEWRTSTFDKMLLCVTTLESGDLLQVQHRQWDSAGGYLQDVLDEYDGSNWLPVVEALNSEGIEGFAADDMKSGSISTSAPFLQDSVFGAVDDVYAHVSVVGAEPGSNDTPFEPLEEILQLILLP